MGLYTHTHTHTDSLENKKGITLVALVVTIVVLLILAGVSINLVLGENGLITKAQEAKRKSHEESIKEQVDMALASYQLEKAKNGEISSLEDNKIENLEIIEENPSEDVKFIAKADDRIIIMKSDGTSIVTKENLVRNGFVTNGNENFSTFINNNRTFSIKTSSITGNFIDDLIPIDNTKKYYEAMIVKADNVKTENYIGLAEFDVDKKIIHNVYQQYKEGSLTYLEKDLNDGDTEIFVNSLDGFVMSNIKLDNRGIIVWNYKDSTGYRYPELTYSRNVYSDIFSNESNFDLEKNKIILDKPWSYGKIEKGTKLSQMSNGSTFNCGVFSGRFDSKEKYYDNIIDGMKTEGGYNTSKFGYATKYIKIWIGLNYSNTQDVTTYIKDVIFAECE